MDVNFFRAPTQFFSISLIWVLVQGTSPLHSQTEVVSTTNDLVFQYHGGASEIINSNGVLRVKTRKNSAAYATLPDVYSLGLTDAISVTFDLTLSDVPENTSSQLEISFSDSATLATSGAIWDGSYDYTVDLDPVTPANGLGFSEGNDNNLGKTSLPAPLATTTHTVTFTLERIGADTLTLTFSSPTLSSVPFFAENDIIPLGTNDFDTIGLSFRGSAWEETFDGSPLVLTVENFSVTTRIAPPVDPPAPGDLKPNILFITVDDLKPTLASYGDPVAVTPNFDRLSTQGVTFLNAHCPWPVCGPARASMTTGLMPEESGVESFELFRNRLPDVITLPQHFRQNGYTTVAVGKWHDQRTSGDGTASQEDTLSWSLPFEFGGGVIGSSQITDRGGRHWPLAAEAKDGLERQFIDGKIAELALDRIVALSSQYKVTGTPFFVAVGFIRPHLPFLAPTPYWDLYERDDFSPHPVQARQQNNIWQIWDNVHEMEQFYALETDTEGFAIPFPWDGSREPNAIADETQKELLHGYYACTSFVDAQIGKLLDELENQGVADNTIVIVIGDHGFHLGDHLKWGKHTLMEEATRIPFILKVPGVGQSGVTSTTPVNMLDIYPTLCALAGLEEPLQPLPEEVQSQYGGAKALPLQGRDLSPLLHHPDESLRTGTITTYRKGPFGYGFRTERYRYTEFIDSGGDVDARQLFDLQNDPLETVNTADDAENELVAYWLATKMRNPRETPGARRLHAANRIPLSQTVYDANEDGDAFTNGYEVDVLGSDPFDPSSPGDTVFGAWKIQMGVSEQGDGADLDQDLLPLLYEYFGAGNPAARDRFPHALKFRGSFPALRATLKRSRIPLDLNVQLMETDSLRADAVWNPVDAGYRILDNGDGTWTHEWVRLQGMTEGSPAFFQLDVQMK